MELMANHAPARESGHSPTVQLLRIMKLTALMLLAATLTVSARTGAQRVTLNVKNVSLNKIFTEIEKQTGYSFVYNNRIIESAKPVTLTVKASTVEDVLKLAFKGQPFNFQLKDNTIIVIPETASVPPVISIAEPPANIDVHGVVKDEAGKPAAGVSVRVKGTNKGTTTNDNGEFKLMGIDPNSTLVFSSINLETYETRLGGRAEVVLVMKAKVSKLQDVEVASISTGYQTIPRERATGSFAFVDNETLNRKVSTNILDRIYDVTPGLYYNSITNIPSVSNKSNIVIRGRSTINSNPNPLIILDNFPYDGDLSTINPNDIENITVLKDAAAASIWGAFAGNGVIVITSKKGKYSQPLRVSVNANVSIGNKPDLYYAPQTSVSDWIDLEVLLFQKGAYTSTLASGSRPVVSPVVDILANRKAGLISATDSASQIDALRRFDTRDDLTKHMYQQSVNQQYSISLNGGNANNKYSFSASFDNNQPNRTYNSYQRTVINASNTYALFKQRLELSMSVQLSQGNTFNNSGSIITSSPYLRLTDNSGNSVVTPRDLRQGYKDTVGQGKLLSWDYRPRDEMSNGSNVIKVNDVHLNLGVRYKILKGLDASFMYQYNTGTNDNQIYYSQQTYFTRDLINRYAQINYSASSANFIIPLGGILDRSNNNYTSQNTRLQINYEYNWGGDHRLNMLAGSELRTIDGEAYSNRQYGYDPAVGTSAFVDYKTIYPQMPSGNAQIPNVLKNSSSNYNYISFLGNAAYSYKRRYTLSGSVRKDESNIFGVSANQKGVPLYSIGASWEISKEAFYKVDWLPYLKLKVTSGSSGNVNQNVAALATATYSSFLNSWGQQTAGQLTPPNESLRWERVNILNLGLNFTSKNDHLTGNVEYYIKKGSDLIASSPIDPTSGIATFTGNTADMQAQGVDIVLNSKNIFTKYFTWSTNFIFNYVADKVTSYNVPKGTISAYTASFATIAPLVGKPLYSVLTYQFAGLDSVGNPQVLLDGKVSEAYSIIRSSKNFDNLKYNGPALPPFFGSLRNTFTYRNLSLYVNINYKFGYYFRRLSFTGSNYTNPNVADYNFRWQKSGDEKITNVPALTYPVNSTRDEIFANSDVLIEKGDNVRLQDIQLSYNFSSIKFLQKLPIRTAQFYFNANNLGILWRANKKRLDPDATLYPIPRSYTLGFRVDF